MGFRPPVGAGAFFLGVGKIIHGSDAEERKSPEFPNEDDIHPFRYRQWALETQEKARFEINLHNCASFALKMLEQSDISIDSGCGKLFWKKHVARMPKDYARPDINTVPQDRPFLKAEWQERLRTEKRSAAQSLHRLFFGLSVLPNADGPRTSLSVLKRHNYFIKSGKLETEQKSSMLNLLSQFLNAEHARFIKGEAYKSLGIEFDNLEDKNFIDPLMDFLIKEQLLSKAMLAHMDEKNVHLELKERDTWRETENYLMSTTTYEDTLKTLLTQYLKIELCSRIEWSLSFPGDHQKVI